jgi:hypothetical protein
LFVDWPPEALPAAGGALVLCVTPSASVNAPLKSFHQRALRGLVLEVRELPSVADSKRCHALFVDGADRSRMAAGVKAQRAAGALLLSDDPEAPAEATAIVLHRTGTKIAFDVNMQPVRQAGVQLSSKLLRLARAVHE